MAAAVCSVRMNIKKMIFKISMSSKSVANAKKVFTTTLYSIKKQEHKKVE